jgi:hypothetical protein
MQRIIIAAAVFLGLITITAFALAINFKKSYRRSVALGFWCAPAHLLPYRFSELNAEQHANDEVRQHLCVSGGSR